MRSPSRALALSGAVTLSLALAACGGDDSASSEASSAAASEAAAAGDGGSGDFPEGSPMAEFADAGAITIGTKFDQPLFGLRGLSGQPEGFDVEIAKIVASGLGIEEDGITFVETPSAIREQALERGDADMVVATYTINDERKERVGFAGPYYVAGQDLMVKADNTEITGPETLRDAGARVCTVTGSTPSENIREYIDESQLVLFDVYSKCADALASDQVDVVTTDNVILIGLVSESDGAFKLVDNAFTEEPYGIGYPKGETEFCEFINDQLTQAAEDGSYQEAWEATAGEVAEQTPELPELEPCA